MSAEAKNNGGQVNSGSFAARAQSAADKNAAGTGNQPSGESVVGRQQQYVCGIYEKLRGFFSRI